MRKHLILPVCFAALTGCASPQPGRTSVTPGSIEMGRTATNDRGSERIIQIEASGPQASPGPLGPQTVEIVVTLPEDQR